MSDEREASIAGAAVEPRRQTLRGRVHAALMPDYNRAAGSYWWVMVALGTAALVLSAMQVAWLPPALVAQTAAGIVMAMIAGMFPVRIPRTTIAIAAAEIFIFLMLAMLGSGPAALAAAAESALASSRASKRWTSRIVSPAIAAVAMVCCGTLFDQAIAAARAGGVYGSGLMVAALIGCSLLYYAVSALLLSAIVLLKRRAPIRPLAILAGRRWVGIAYAGSASVAALVFLASKQFGSPVLIAAVPIIAMLLLTLHHHFDRQLVQYEVQQARLEAAERELESAARHASELAQSEQRFHRAFTNAPIGMALVSFGGRMLQVNRALQTLLGLSEAEAVGSDFARFIHGNGAAEFAARLVQMAHGEAEAFAAELVCRHHRGADVRVALHVSLLTERGAGATSLILQVQDITARRHAEDQLSHMAFHDSLTGLPNRSHFSRRLAQAVEHAKRDPGYRYAVLFFDFDRFKLLNDSLGHVAGDDLLVQASRRVQEHIRPHDIVARFGGDEFAVLSESLQDTRDTIRMAERLQQQLQLPFQIGGRQISMSASIGITFSDSGPRTPDEVLRDADTAMYRAKAAGKACYVVFDESLHVEVLHRMQLEADLRRALDAGQFDLVYQPLFDLATGKLDGFEALVRWKHPQLGLISPAVFIPVAEEAGLMLPITDFVLNRACRQLSRWQARRPAFSNLTMRVNISGRDIEDTRLQPRIVSAIIDAGLKPEQLAIELTENILMERLSAALRTLEDLRALGVGLSIDDFGIGHSSLAHLCSLPVDGLKIDASFVRSMRPGNREAETVRAIISLGKVLGKTVTAEGIETAAQRDQLRELGCQYGQGYHLARPLAAEDVEALFASIERRVVYVGATVRALPMRG